MPAPSVPKRRYRVDPEMARERARRAALARNSPDSYIRSRETACLTIAQKRRLAALLMPWLGENQDGAA